MYPYNKAVALCNLYPDSTFVIQVDGYLLTACGAVVSGFLRPDDKIDYLKKWN